MGYNEIMNKSKIVYFGFCLVFLILIIWRYQIIESRIKNSELNKYNDSEQEEQKEFVVLVNKILELNQQLQESVSKDQKERIQEEIKRIDGQIDRKVFELYLINKKEQKRILQD